MKRMLMAAVMIVLLATAASADAVTYYKDGSYRNGGVTLRMDAPMGTVFNPGEEVRFSYQSLHDSYVILFNIDTEGYVHIVSPVPGADIPRARAGRSYGATGNGERLLVDGETGVEFMFALTVPERSAIDSDELRYLTDQSSGPADERYRIDGDPFLAANIIAGELVRGISRRPGVFIDYTYFYVNERVSYPCYLFGNCDAEDEIVDVQVVADFQRGSTHTYPLRRAYNVHAGSTEFGDDAEYALEPETFKESRVDVNFYPFSSEVYSDYNDWDDDVDVNIYVHGGRYSPYYYSSWYYDPWYCGWDYYPSSSWWVGIGWGYSDWRWNRGYWYCKPYRYRPYYHSYGWNYWRDCYYDYNYAGYYGSGKRVATYKDSYKHKGEATYSKGLAYRHAKQSFKTKNSKLVAAGGAKTKARSSTYAKAGVKSNGFKSSSVKGKTRIGTTKIRNNGKSKSYKVYPSKGKTRSVNKPVYSKPVRGNSGKGSKGKLERPSSRKKTGSAVKGKSSSGKKRGTAAKKPTTKKKSSVKKNSSSSRRSAAKAPARSSSRSSKASSRGSSSKSSRSKGKRK